MLVSELGKDDFEIDVYNGWVFGSLSRREAIALLQFLPGSWALWRIWRREPVGS